MEDVPDEYSYNNAALVGGSIFAPNTANRTYLQALMLNADNEVPGTLDALKRIQAKRIKGKKPARSSASSEKLSPALRAALNRKTASGGSLIGAIIKFGIQGGIKRLKEVFGARKEQKAELARLRAKKAQMGGKRIRGGSFKSFLSDLKTMFATPIMPLNVALLVKKKQREKEIAKLKKEVGEGEIFGPAVSPAVKKKLNDFVAKHFKKKATGGGIHFSPSTQEILKKYLGNRVRTQPRGGTDFNDSIKHKLLTDLKVNPKKPIPNGIDINKERREAEERLQELMKKYVARHGK